MGKKTTKEFVEQAIVVHGDLYSYEDTQYKNSGTKVVICCKIHGAFEQVAKDHLSGRGCRFCARVGSNLELFLKAAELFHRGRYNYSLVDYINCYTPVEIICDEHGVFLQKPIYHTRGSNCPDCAKKSLNRNPTGWSRGRYLERADMSHNGYSHLYIMHCYSDSESFYKVGISFKGGKQRLKYSGYKTRTLLNLKMPAEICWDAEKYLHRELADFRYKPLKVFCGSSRECYTGLDTNAILLIDKLKEEFDGMGEYGKFVAALKKDGQEIEESLTPEKCDLLHMAMGLVLEAAELGDCIKKHVIYNKPLDRENAIEELGDIMFYMEGLMQNIQVSGTECIDANIKKLGVRYQGGVYSDQAAQERADKQ